MDIQKKRGLIKKLRELRGGNFLITYITSTRPGLETAMAMDAVRKIYRHLELIKTPKKETKIDLFIHSNGGDGIVPWRLVTLIREYCNEFNVLVPHRAFSAATLTAIGADSIYMHPMGMLGPTDPKVSNEFNPPDPSNPNNKLGINVEDVFSYISLIKEDVGINHEDELVKTWEFLAGENRVHPLALGNVKRFYAQSRMMAQKLLELHMDKSTEEHNIKEIADNLNSKLYFHGHPINRAEAKDQLGLKIKDTSQELEVVMWELYQSYEEEMQLEKIFNPPIELKSQHPDLPVITNNQNVSTENVILNGLNVVYIESETRSDYLTTDLRIEGYRVLTQNGLQEIISLSQLKEQWQEDVVSELETPKKARGRPPKGK